MSILNLIACCMLYRVSGFQPALTFSRASTAERATFRLQAASVRMDMEGDSIDGLTRSKIHQQLFSDKTGPIGGSPLSDYVDMEGVIERAEGKYGMPWRDSIQKGSPLLYMPFWEWQMDFMKENLSGLKIEPMEERFEYNENLKKKARMFNMNFSSDQYRKIRMTYYDAGEGCQVFNSVFYPDPKYNAPVLGIDLLSFGGKKYLAIVDFQPIHEDEKDHSLTYTERLSPVKAEYPSLKGKMSSKFYDETKFFSQEMLFSRFDDVNIIQDELMEAYQRYVKIHTDLVSETPAADSVADKYAVLDRQAAYDTYSADRDPATGMFAAMYGKEWADDFVYDFLFSMSQRGEEKEAPQVRTPPTPQEGPVKGSMHIMPSTLSSASTSKGAPVNSRQR